MPEMLPVDAVLSAAGYLSREWGENRNIGPGTAVAVRSATIVYAFECSASDGSRWFIVTDRWGNRTHGDTIREAVHKWANDRDNYAGELVECKLLVDA